MKTWKLAGILVAVIFVAAYGLRAAEPGSATDSDLQKLLHDRLSHINAATCIVVGLLDEKGERFFSEGVLSQSDHRAADGDTLFEIGSVTKVFTALVLANAVQRGEVRLDDPVAKFLPPTVKVPSRNGRQITLVDLATQSSGLPRLPTNLSPKSAANPYADYGEDQLYEFLSNYKLPRDIGAKYEYSNVGVGLLGHVLSLATHKEYEALVVDRIASPLHLDSTRITLSADLKSRLAVGYGLDGTPVGPWEMSVLAGAGAIHSPARDMLKFLSANLGLTRSDLWPAMQMTHEPRHDTDLPNVEIGLCWHITKSPQGPIVWHNGQTAGFHAFIAFDPQKKKGVVVLINAGASIDDLGFHLLDPNHPLSKLPKERTAIALKPEVLDQYVGRYEVAPNVYFTIERKENQLRAQLTGQSFFEIYPESEIDFFYKVVDAQISFEKNDQGKVVSLVLHQAGQNVPAKKTDSQGK